MDRSDRLDRPGGLPLGAATQSMGRGLPENPAQGRRVVAGGSLGQITIPVPPLPPPPPPVPNIRSTSIGSALAASAPLAASQIMALAREAIRDALRDSNQQVGDAGEVSSELKRGSPST